MGLLEAYKDIIKSFQLDVTSDGFIKYNNKNLTIDGLPVVLPTKEHIETLTAATETGEFKPVKYLFNPLKENLVKGESPIVKKLMKIAEITANVQLAAASRLLLQLGRLDNVKDLPISLNQFLILLEQARSKNIKELIDDGVMDHWTKLVSESVTSNKHRIAKYYLKKNIEVQGEKFYRGIVLDSPILDVVEESNLRGKEKRVYKILVNFLLKKGTENENFILSYSNNDYSPSFTALAKGYMMFTNRINDLLKSLEFIDKEIVNKTIVPIHYDMDKLHFEKYATEIAMLPEVTENGANVMTTDLNNRSNNVEQFDPYQAALQQAMVDDTPQQTQTMQPTQQQVHQTTPQSNSDVMSEEEVKQLLYGGGPSRNQQYQQPMVPQNQPIIPQPTGVPMQQAYCPPQQQMYGQPMRSMNQGITPQPTGMPMQQQYGQPAYGQQQYMNSAAPGVPFNGPYASMPQYR